MDRMSRGKKFQVDLWKEIEECSSKNEVDFEARKVSTCWVLHLLCYTNVKKSKSPVARMRWISKLGKFLVVGGSLIFSAILTIFLVDTYESVREEYAAKVSRVMDFLEYYFGLTSTTKLDMVRWFVLMFNFTKIVGAYLLLLEDIFINEVGTLVLMFYFVIATPVVYDFYLYKVGDSEFFVLLHDFMQNLALCSAVWFLMRMKLKLYGRLVKKKPPKSKCK